MQGKPSEQPALLEGANRRDRRQNIREDYNKKMGFEERPIKSFGAKGHHEAEGSNIEKSKPKEWKAGSGKNGWGMDNMHPSWAAKKNAEQESVGLISKSARATKIIDL